MTTMAKIFRIKPILAISCIFINPDENTIAFGGVPTGNINAQLAARVSGIHKYSGGNPNEIEKLPTTGTIIVTKAKFDIISVINIPINTTINKIERSEFFNLNLF